MNPNISPAYILRDYMWKLIKANTNLSESDYGGMIPIVPVSEEPELSQYSKPTMVYGYAIDPTTRGFHAETTGSMTVAIYSTNFREITKILNILLAAFEREDDAARDVNLYVGRPDGYDGIRFGTINIGFLQGPTPEETEGGNQSGMINIRFSCFVDYEVDFLQP